MKRIGMLLAAVTVMAFSVQDTQAKPLGVLMAKSGLTPKDFNLMGATETQLYSPSVKSVGSTLSWSNPESGATGTVKLVSRDGNCVTIHHVVYGKDKTTPIVLKPRMCESSEGNWLLAP